MAHCRLGHSRVETWICIQFSNEGCLIRYEDLEVGTTPPIVVFRRGSRELPFILSWGGDYLSGTALDVLLLFTHMLFQHPRRQYNGANTQTVLW